MSLIINIFERYESHRMCLGEHSGTHLDSPRHFSEHGWTTEQIPLSHLVASGKLLKLKSNIIKLILKTMRIL